VEFLVQVQQVELQEGVNRHAAHSNKVNKEHQVAEIDKCLILECFEKRMKTVHSVRSFEFEVGVERCGPKSKILVVAVMICGIPIKMKISAIIFHPASSTPFSVPETLLFPPARLR
jgi:hypothetical protein